MYSMEKSLRSTRRSAKPDELLSPREVSAVHFLQLRPTQQNREPLEKNETKESDADKISEVVSSELSSLCDEFVRLDDSEQDANEDDLPEFEEFVIPLSDSFVSKRSMLAKGTSRRAKARNEKLLDNMGLLQELLEERNSQDTSAQDSDDEESVGKELGEHFEQLLRTCSHLKK